MAEALRRDSSCDASSETRPLCGVPADEMARLLTLARTIGTGVRALRVDSARGI